MAHCCPVSQWIDAFCRCFSSRQTDSEFAERALEPEREYVDYIAACPDETDSSGSNPWADLLEAPPPCVRMQEAEKDWLERGGRPYEIWRFDNDLPCTCNENNVFGSVARRVIC